jgi:uncharacterized protein (TIGR00369 family)
MHNVDAARHHFGTLIPFMDLLGLHAEELRPGYARARIAHRPAMSNSRGDFHGGVLMSALDATMGLLAHAENRAGAGAVTVDMNTSFLAAAASDIVIEARVLRLGNSIAFIEGEVRDDGGLLVAKASGTFKLLRRRAPAEAHEAAGAQGTSS